MIQLAEDVFAVRTDPEQLDVDEAVMERLQRIHPSTLSAFETNEGPAVWILLLPTTTALMNAFLQHQISEKELYLHTPDQGPYEVIYLCSALVLEEYRNKGLACQLTCEGINAIRNDHPIKALLVWPFSEAGEALAQKVASLTSLPLYKRE